MSDANPEPNTKVLYNNQCPVCSYEITHYKGYSERCDLPIRFDDLNTEAAHWGMDADVAAFVGHARVSGALDRDAALSFIGACDGMARCAASVGVCL
jgi:hypothetical protein